MWALRAAACIAIAAMGWSCRRVPEPSNHRLGILPFENLTGDETLDWAGAAVVGMLASGMSGSATLTVIGAASPRDAVSAHADQLLEGYLEKRGGAYRFMAVLRDLTSQRVVWSYETSATVETLPAVSQSLAKKMEAPFRLTPAKNPEALRNWGNALLARNSEQRAEALRLSIEADPDFGTAYADLAQMWQSMGNAAGARELVERSRSRLGAFGEVDRARMKTVDAELRDDTPAQIDALSELSRLIPTDGKLLEMLAAKQLRRRQYGAAAKALQQASVQSPEDWNLLNQLGYVAAYAGRPDESRAALERYRALQPDQPNPSDSLGETQYALGRFADAEKHFLDAHARSANFLGGFSLMKAAQARLMAGDLKGADELAQKYAKLRKDGHDPLIEVQRAQWLYLTGRRKEAADMAGKAASVAGDAAAYARVQLAVWNLIEGDREQARSFTSSAAQASGNPAVRNLAATVQFLAQPKMGAEAWAAAAARALQDPGARSLLTAYALLLCGGEFQEALPVLKDLYDKADPANDGSIRTLYAWALVEAGKVTEAAPLVEYWPLPMTGNGAPFTALEFPRFIALRAAVRERQGRGGEAAAARALLGKLPAK